MLLRRGADINAYDGDACSEIVFGGQRRLFNFNIRELNFLLKRGAKKQCGTWISAAHLTITEKALIPPP